MCYYLNILRSVILNLKYFSKHSVKWRLSACAKLLQSCPTLFDPIDGSPPAPLSLGFSRQEHWSGLPFPSPMHGSEAAQSCQTFSDPMDCSLPGSSHGIFQARVPEWVALPSCHILKVVEVIPLQRNTVNNIVAAAFEL